MPNCGGSTIRSQSPYKCNVNRSRRQSIAPRPSTCQPISDQIGEQLLLSLVQSLPLCVMDTARSRSFSPSALRRRTRTNGGRSLKVPSTMTYSKTPLRLQMGMPVRQVSGQDRTGQRAGEQVKPFKHCSVETFLMRRKESSMAKAKARDKEYERIPKMRGEKKRKEFAMAQAQVRAEAKAREEEYERIPKIKGESSENKSIQSISPKSSNEITKRRSRDTLEEEPEEVPAPTKTQNRINDQTKKTNDKIFPCFRGEYPTRHCKDSYLWFEAGVPNCGKLVTICDGKQQVLGPAEIVTACEVTESHYLEMDEENADDLPTVNPCKNCRQRSCVGHQRSSFGQQRSCEAQQQGSFGQQRSSTSNQQQSSCGQQRSSVGQQQSPFAHPPRPCSKRLNCRQNSPHKVCWKCQDQQQLALQMQNQTTPQPQPQPQQQQLQQQQQHIIQCNSYGVNEMLAEELKQQMQEAQAQIAKVQQQLNSVCGCNSGNCPSYVPTTCSQYMMGQDADETFENNQLENLEEPSLQQQEWPTGSRENSGLQPIQFGYYPMTLAVPNPSPGFQDEAMPMPMTFSCHQLPPCRQPVPPCQQDYPCQQERSPYQPEYPCQQERPPYQQDPSQPNKCSHAPQCCPSWYFQRYAKMRFMMPRCWPR
ncbi:hypothetical protein KR038_010149 [Drosophila bunnanda]|nr:hypothetical protein KR038_010149 [Drosophila bunnanda]